MAIQENNSRFESPQAPFRWRIGRWIWQQCAAKGALLPFLVPIILALAMSMLLPQIPAHIRSDPIGYQKELSAVQVQFKSWTPFLEAIGAFYVIDTLWFRILLAALSFTLLIALGSEINSLLTPSSICRPKSFYDSATTVSVSGSSPRDHVVETVQKALRSYARRVRYKETEEGIHLYGSTATWAKAGTAVAYLGILFLSVGLAVNGRWGWQQDNIRVPSNESISIGPQGNHDIRLVDVKTEPVEEINVQIDGARTLPIRWAARENRGNFRYRWVSKGGPFVQVHAQRANEERLHLYNYESRPTRKETLHFAFSPQESKQEADRLFIVAETKVVGWLAWMNKEAEAGTRPRFYLWVFAEDRHTPLGEREFTVSDADAVGGRLEAQIDDITYILDVTRYVVVDVAYQPGLWALWVGGLLFVSGASISVIPRRQTWAQITHDQARYEIRLQESRAPFGLLRHQQSRSFARLGAHIQSTQDSEQADIKGKG